MSRDFKRRDFVAAAGALAGATLWPAPAPAPAAPASGRRWLTRPDSGRDRTVADPNSARALGSGYPLLVASAALAAYPDRGLRFYNRGISGNKVPDLQARWADDVLALKPDVLSILIGVNDFWHTLSHGYTGTVQDYETQFTALLDETTRALPNARLVILEPFVLRCGAVDDRWFPEFDQRRAAAARVAQHARATFIGLQKTFDDIAEHWRRAAHL